MSLAGLLGPLAGPTLGGWLVEVATWHWIFLINIPMGVLYNDIKGHAKCKRAYR